MTFGISSPCNYGAVEANAYNAYSYSVNNAISKLIYASDEELNSPGYIEYVLSEYGLSSADSSTLEYILHAVECTR